MFQSPVHRRFLQLEYEWQLIVGGARLAPFQRRLPFRHYFQETEHLLREEWVGATDDFRVGDTTILLDDETDDDGGLQARGFGHRRIPVVLGEEGLPSGCAAWVDRPAVHLHLRVDRVLCGGYGRLPFRRGCALLCGEVGGEEKAKQYSCPISQKYIHTLYRSFPQISPP